MTENVMSVVPYRSQWRAYAEDERGYFETYGESAEAAYRSLKNVLAVKGEQGEKQ